MTDNTNSKEAQTVLSQSEFIKCVEDFAHFVQKEYVTEGSDCSLIICASDCSLDNEENTGVAQIMMGNRMQNTKAILSMMNTDGFSELFRLARIISLDEEDEDAATVIEDKRKSLRFSYIVLAVNILWCLFVVVTRLFGVGSWLTVIAILLLMGYSIDKVVMDIIVLRRQIKRINKQVRSEFREKVKYRIAELQEAYRNLVQQDDDDDDE